jgi:hypothetical protein
MRAILVTVALFTVGGTAFAQQPCNNHLLNDDYGVQISGTRPSIPGPLAPAEQVVGVAMGHFDGRGGYTQLGSTHGSISGVTSGTPGTGSYVVNSDCTGVITFQNAGQPFAIQVAIVVVGQGDEVKGATMDPSGIMVAAVWRKK